MRTTSRLIAAFLCVLMSAQIAAAQQWKISGPYTHANLAVYLVHGQSTTQTEYLTLAEALVQDKVTVYEGEQNQLSIENRSSQLIYVQAGDIVKGGHQDRSLGTDYVLAPNSGQRSIAAFCVEAGRSSARGDEPVDRFTSSDNLLAGRVLKLAGNENFRGSRQQLVWDEIESTQRKLSTGVKANFETDLVSPTSFELTLENANVRRGVQPYVNAIGGAIEGKDDVIGCAVAINGRFSGADVYGSSALFRKLWPRLLNSAAVEAVAELKPGDQVAAPAADAIRVALKEAERGEVKETRVNERTLVKAMESHRAMLFETLESGESFLHRGYFSKD